MVLSDYVIKNFFLIWSLIPLILIPYSFFKYGSKKSTAFLKVDGLKNSETIFELNVANFILAGVFLAYLCLYIYLILYQEDFAYDDNHQFTHLSLQGRNIDLPIWLDNGRFFPLGHQEFNLLRFLSKSPTGYHAFALLQLLIVLAGLFIILSNLPVWFRLLVMTLVMSTTSFVMSFFGLIYPERNVIFWLTILLVCFQYFLKTRAHFYFGGALIAAQFALYYKEPVFLLIGGFAGSRLLLHSLLERSLPRRRRSWQFGQTHLLDVGLLILVGFFFLLYTITILPSMNFGYATTRSIGTFSVLVNYLKFDLWLSVFLLALLTRFLYLIFARKLPDLFWDSLAVGAFFYFLAYIKLQMFSGYYMAPVDFVAILYLGQLIYPWFHDKKIVLYTIATLIICLIAGQNAVYSSFHIIERKNLIQSKVQLTRFLKDYAEQSNTHHVTLFFPYTNSDFRLMLLSTFLEYKGWRLAKDEPPESTGEVTITVKSPRYYRNYRNNYCVDWGWNHKGAPPYGKCFYAKVPRSGDLIVVLGDDQVSTKELIQLKQESTLLFHYQPYLPIPPKILPIFSKFPAISKISKFAPITDNWLHVYVFQKP